MRRDPINSRWILLVTVLFGSAAWGAFVFHGRQNSATGGRHALRVAPYSLDFGQAWEQPNFPWELVISNPTPKDVEVVDIRNSCNCVSVELTSFAIPAGGMTRLKLRLDLRGKDPGDASRPWRDYEANLLAITKTQLPAQNMWTVRGRVYRYPLALSSARVDFGESLIQGSNFQPMTVNVECLWPTGDLAARCDASMADVRLERDKETPEHYRVAVLPRNDLAAGRHEFSVYLRPRIAEHDLPAGMPALPELAIGVVANVARDVYASPSCLNFGAVPVGKMAVGTVMLGSVRHEQFVVVETRTDTAISTSVDTNVEKRGQTKSFRVSQRVAEVGPHSGEVRFVVREGDRRLSYAIVVPVSYHGVSKQQITK